MKKKLKVLLSVGLAISSIALQLGNIPVIADENSTGKTVVSESEDMKIANNADIIFAIDSTGSMGSYIDSVKENLTNFVTSLNEKGVSLNMSVVEFRDIEEDGTDSTIYYNFDGSKWTSDVNKVIDVFDSIDVSGGGDDPETPIDAFEKIVRKMKEQGIGYGAINHPIDRDPVCGYNGIIGDACPNCGRTESDGKGNFERIRRITGYLVGTLERFNNGKRAEEHDRVKHGIKNK